jgi:hypothetical protein
LNTFASGLKTVRAEQKSKPAVREDQTEYLTISLDEIPDPLFDEAELKKVLDKI